GADAGDEVGGAESPAVVTHAGLDIHRAGRSTAFLGGIAGGVDIDRTYGFDVQSRLEPAADRIGNIEAVQGEVGLVGGAAIEMQTPANVLHDALQQRHRVAQIL